MLLRISKCLKNRQFLAFSLILSGKANTKKDILTRLGMEPHNQNISRYVKPLEYIGLIAREKIKHGRNFWRINIEKTYRHACISNNIWPDRDGLPDLFNGIYENEIIKKIADPTRKGVIEKHPKHNLFDLLEIYDKKEIERIKFEYMMTCFWKVPAAVMYCYVKGVGKLSVDFSLTGSSDLFFTKDDIDFIIRKVMTITGYEWNDVHDKLMGFEIPPLIINPEKYFVYMKRDDKRLFFDKENQIRCEKLFKRYKNNPAMADLKEKGRTLQKYNIIDGHIVGKVIRTLFKIQELSNKKNG
jgi:hypothetical protein